MTTLTRAEVREIDRRAIEEFGVPGVVLMENAGRGAADVLLSLGIGGPVLICCGKGNNGGDGLVLARHLDNWHFSVQVLLFAGPDELSPDGGPACCGRGSINDGGALPLAKQLGDSRRLFAVSSICRTRSTELPREINATNGCPSARQTIASPVPVLPLVSSTTV